MGDGTLSEDGAPSLEYMDQEITLQLQKIDSNLSYCFNKITKDIIPTVTQYGLVCDETLSSCNWLKEMFQKSADVQLLCDEDQRQESALGEAASSIFPKDLNVGTGNGAAEALDNASTVPASLVGRGKENLDTTSVTTTGQVLVVPVSSDEEDDRKGKTRNAKEPAPAAGNADEEEDNSTLQRQQKKRKLSLMLQQRYGSSSSSSFISRSPTLHKNFSRVVDDTDSRPMSSPLQRPDEERPEDYGDLAQHHEESTKEVLPRTPTVIRFNTE